MEKRIVIGVAAVAGAVGLLYIMKRQTSQATNTAAANTSGSASALLGGLLSGWANPSAVIPKPEVVAANGTIVTPAPAPARIQASSTTVQEKPLVVIGGTEIPQQASTMQGEELERWKAVQPAMKKLFAGWGQNSRTDGIAGNPAPAPAPVAVPAAPVWGTNGENFA